MRAADSRNGAGLLLALTTAGIAFSVQQTMLVPALPDLQRDLGTSREWATWLLTGFLMSASVAIPILGALGDRYGRNRLLQVSLGIYLIGCLGAAASPGIATLIASRMLQGAGAAVFPLSFAIIRDEFPPERIGGAAGVVSSVFAVGGGIGLVLAGPIVDHGSWRWLFVVTAVFAVVGIWLTRRYVPTSPVRNPARLDIPGAALLASTLLTLMIALTQATSWGWSSPRILTLFVLSLVLFVLWLVVELHTRTPMLEVRMLTNRTILVTNVTAFISGFASLGAFVLIPLLAQVPRGAPPEIAAQIDFGFGATTTEVGLLLLPGAMIGLLAAVFTGALIRRWGAWWPLVLGLALYSVGVTYITVWHSHPAHVVLGVLVLGVGPPMAFAAMGTLVVQAVAQTETGIATGMNTVMRTVGGVIGGQLAAAILASHAVVGTDIPAETSFELAFAIGAAAAAAGALLAASLGARHAGRQSKPADGRTIAEPSGELSIGDARTAPSD